MNPFLDERSPMQGSHNQMMQDQQQSNPRTMFSVKMNGDADPSELASIEMGGQNQQVM